MKMPLRNGWKGQKPQRRWGKRLNALDVIVRFRFWITPPKTNMEPQNWWFVDVSPFQKWDFQVPCLFSGV